MCRYSIVGVALVIYVVSLGIVIYASIESDAATRGSVDGKKTGEQSDDEQDKNGAAQ